MTETRSAYRLAVFDMDGTLVESHFDWARIKEDLGISQKNILREIYRDGAVDRRRLALLEAYERDHTRKTKPLPGVHGVIDFLRGRGVALALLTNNNRPNTEYLMAKFNFRFDWILTRENGLWKPDPDPFLHLMERAASPPGNTLAIGDSTYDIEAAKNAEIRDIFIKTNNHVENDPVDGVRFFEDYAQLRAILEHRGL